MKLEPIKSSVTGAFPREQLLVQSIKNNYLSREQKDK
jgi:hypothetical protein